MMKFICFASVVIVSLCSIDSSVFAQNIGLHNSTKKFTKQSAMVPSDVDDPNQIIRSWKAAIVRIPNGNGRSKRTNLKKLTSQYADGETKFPTAIYMHGCAGIWPGTHQRIKFLADNGFLVIAPASFARTKYPMSCNPVTNKGGMYRPTLRMRQLDAGYAIETAKSLPFVDKDNILLIGLSQGGITVATFKAANDSQSVAARVIEGWTCAAGWYEYVGVNAPSSEPVLSLVGVKDPWFQNPWNQGHCGPYMNKENGSKSVVFEKGNLAKRHELLEFKTVQREVLSFIKAHIDLPLNTKDVQRILTNLGFDPGPVDGAWGAKTLNALNQLRAKHGLKPTEKLDTASQKLLHKLNKS